MFGAQLLTERAAATRHASTYGTTATATATTTATATMVVAGTATVAVAVAVKVTAMAMRAKEGLLASGCSEKSHTSQIVVD